VSPILRGAEGRRRLAATLHWINKYDLVKVDKRCGYHVHIDLTGIDFEGLKRICQNWVKYEDAIDLILPPSRRGDDNRSVRAVRENHNFWDRNNLYVNKRIAKAENKRALLNLMNPIISDDSDEFYNPQGRYYKMNLRTGHKNTIEFRAHGATHDPEKAKRWVNFLTAFVEASAANRAPKSFIEDRTPEYKFEKMFKWVVRGRLMRKYYRGRANELSRE